MNDPTLPYFDPSLWSLIIDSASFPADWLRLGLEKLLARFWTL